VKIKVKVNAKNNVFIFKVLAPAYLNLDALKKVTMGV